MGDESKVYWFIVLGAAAVGLLKGHPGLALLVVALGVAYWIYNESKWEIRENRYKHLNGKYKVDIRSATRLGALEAVVEYRGQFDGSFDIDKIYSPRNPNADVWGELTESEKGDIQYELRQYFWKLRGHGPVAR